MNKRESKARLTPREGAMPLRPGARAAEAKRLKLVVGTELEIAMAKWLRRGIPIRRLEWHSQSKIFRLGEDVFVQLPHTCSRAPSVWKPYPEDFLATDWVKA